MCLAWPVFFTARHTSGGSSASLRRGVGVFAHGGERQSRVKQRSQHLRRVQAVRFGSVKMRVAAPPGRVCCDGALIIRGHSFWRKRRRSRKSGAGLVEDDVGEGAGEGDQKSPDFKGWSSLCPQGDSNSCLGLERATSWSSRRWGLTRRIVPCALKAVKVESPVWLDNESSGQDAGLKLKTPAADRVVHGGVLQPGRAC